MELINHSPYQLCKRVYVGFHRVLREVPRLMKRCKLGDSWGGWCEGEVGTVEGPIADPTISSQGRLWIKGAALGYTILNKTRKKNSHLTLKISYA